MKVSMLQTLYIGIGAQFYYYNTKAVIRLEREYKAYLGLGLTDKTQQRISARFLCSVFFVSGVPPRFAQEFTQPLIRIVCGQPKGYVVTQCRKMVDLGYFRLVRRVGVAPVYVVTDKFAGLFDRDWLLLLHQRVTEFKQYEERERKKGKRSRPSA